MEPTSRESRPSVFIGSSSEGLAVAEAFRNALRRDAAVTVWHKGVFGLGDGTLESLVAATKRVDFAILVLTPDDLTTSRKRRQQSPRDNVLFECGLFIGTLGRHRTYVTFDRRTGIKIPSDLAGVTLAAYGDRGDDQPLARQIEPAVSLIRAAIRERGQLRPLPHPFWRPFTQGQSRIVLGRYRQFLRFEASGVVGLGDAACLTEMVSFARSEYQLELPVTYADRMSGDELSAHLLLVGGPDANSVTQEVVSRIPTTLILGDPKRAEISFIDGVTRQAYAPEFRADDVSADYGVILRTTSPFDRKRKVLMLFGCFGFGTWAAGRFVCGEEFLAHPLTSSGADVECVVRTEIVRGAPQHTHICMLREAMSASG
jgi:hypothetical protein